MPELVQKCLESWHKFMPDWKYKLWNEDNFDVNSVPYTKEAYEAGKYAFVSDFVRLKALFEEGGLYLDVDFMVYKSFDDLMENDAFAGFEGSKHSPVMMGVCASKARGKWVSRMYDAYSGKHFMVDGVADLTPNVTFLSPVMRDLGLKQNGLQQHFLDLTVYPVEYFCPLLTTGEYHRTDDTYCESVGETVSVPLSVRLIGRKNMIRLIKLKRKFEKIL